MRSLWIASGLAFALLTLAVVVRPAAEIDATPASAGDVPPHPLAAEDLSQILALRAQFGSPVDRFGGAEASQAAFAQQLREVAGVKEKSPPGVADRILDQEPVMDSVAASQAVLRNAAAELDQLASQAEDSGRYVDADRHRTLAGNLRQLARNAVHFGNDDNLRPALIDNGGATQAQ